MIRMAFGTVVALAGFVALAMWSVHERPPGGGTPGTETVDAAVEGTTPSVETGALDPPVAEVAPASASPEIEAQTRSSRSETVAEVGEDVIEEATISDERTAPFVEAALDSSLEVVGGGEEIESERDGVAPVGRDAELAAELIRRMLAVYVRTQPPR